MSPPRQEIRNHIYDLVFAPSDPTAAIELKDARPPTKDLILTCRKVHTEAGAMFKSAYRAFWSESKFVVSLSAAQGENGQGEAERAQQYRAVVNGEGIARNIAHIKHIAVYSEKAKFVLVDGVWEATHSACSHSTCSCRDFRMLLVTKDQSAVLRDAGIACRSDCTAVLTCLPDNRVTPETFQTAVGLVGKRSLMVEDLEAVLQYLEIVRL